MFNILRDDMNKHNENNIKSNIPLVYELTNNPILDNIKIDIIKEAIKNNDYNINSKNIANKLLEFSKINVHALAID